MVCVLALLFPVISLTDDLHPETVAVDAASGKRNACLIAASAPQVRAATLSSAMHLALGRISRPLAAVDLTISKIPEISKLHNSDILVNTCRDRSPPSFV